MFTIVAVVLIGPADFIGLGRPGYYNILPTAAVIKAYNTII